MSSTRHPGPRSDPLRSCWSAKKTSRSRSRLPSSDTDSISLLPAQLSLPPCRILSLPDSSRVSWSPPQTRSQPAHPPVCPSKSQPVHRCITA